MQSSTHSRWSPATPGAISPGGGKPIVRFHLLPHPIKKFEIFPPVRSTSHHTQVPSNNHCNHTCNTPVHSEGWRIRAQEVWKRYGFKPQHRNRGPYGGLAGAQTANMIGKHGWPMVIITEPAVHSWELATPLSMSVETNEIE